MSAPIVPFPQSSATARTAPETVAFDRRELSVILGLYGRMVAAGEWRDYAIDHLREVALFSIFRRSSEAPLYRVEKRPKLAARQGAYAVLGADGRVLKRGADLARVILVLQPKPRLID